MVDSACSPGYATTMDFRLSLHISKWDPRRSRDWLNKLQVVDFQYEATPRANLHSCVSWRLTVKQRVSPVALAAPFVVSAVADDSEYFDKRLRRDVGADSDCQVDALNCSTESTCPRCPRVASIPAAWSAPPQGHRSTKTVGWTDTPSPIVPLAARGILGAICSSRVSHSSGVQEAQSEWLRCFLCFCSVPSIVTCHTCHAHCVHPHVEMTSVYFPLTSTSWCMYVLLP